MSKSILDMVTEALEQPDNSVIFKHTCLNELKKTLEQALKQKELLEYYNELLETIEILERDYNYGLFKFNGIKYTYNKIKELENEI